LAALRERRRVLVGFGHQVLRLLLRVGHDRRRLLLRLGHQRIRRLLPGFDPFFADTLDQMLQFFSHGFSFAP
jgi:hypothetical protein